MRRHHRSNVQAARSVRFPPIQDELDYPSNDDGHFRTNVEQPRLTSRSKPVPNSSLAVPQWYRERRPPRRNRPARPPVRQRDIDGGCGPRLRSSCCSGAGSRIPVLARTSSPQAQDTEERPGASVGGSDVTRRWPAKLVPGGCSRRLVRARGSACLVLCSGTTWPVQSYTFSLFRGSRRPPDTAEALRI
jgi:hypothetical protein